MPALVAPSPARPGLADRPLTGARRVVRWGVEHAAARALVARAARRGDPQARLISDPTVRDSPYALQDELRARGPLVPAGISWVTAHHAVCKEVLRSEDVEVAAGNDALLPPPVRRLAGWAKDTRALGPIDPPSLLAVEPPDHTRYRRLVSKVFTARAVEALRGDVQEVADRLVDDLLRERGRTVDLVGRYATLLPVTVIARILGVPESERSYVLSLGNRVAASLDMGLSYREFVSVQRGLRDFNAYMEAHLQRLRRSPGDDLLSQLVTAEDEGSRLDDLELRSTAGLLLGAGFETTVNLLGSGARLLAETPAQLEVLRAEPSRWPDAVEEALRFESPVQVTARVTVRDTTLAGVRVPARRVVTTLLAAANRDPAVFDDPHRFDVTRRNARDHLAFSGGRHFCLGAALARVEGEVGLRTLFDRVPDLRVEPGAVRRPTRVLRGWETLPVSF